MKDKRTYADRREELIRADKGYTRSWGKVKAELDKCILVCANCHREIEGGITQLPRVTGDGKTR